MREITKEEEMRLLHEIYMPGGAPTDEVRRDYLAMELPPVARQAYSFYLAANPSEQDRLYDFADKTIPPMSEAERNQFAAIERRLLGFPGNEDRPRGLVGLRERLEELWNKGAGGAFGQLHLAPLRKGEPALAGKPVHAGGRLIAARFVETLISEISFEVGRKTSPESAVDGMLTDTITMCREIIADNAIPPGREEAKTFATDFFESMQVVMDEARRLIRFNDDQIPGEAADMYEQIASWAKRAHLVFPSDGSWKATEAHMERLYQRLHSLASAFGQAEIMIRRREGGGS